MILFHTVGHIYRLKKLHQHISLNNFYKKKLLNFDESN